MVSFGVQKCPLSGVFFGPGVKKCKERNYFLWGSYPPEKPTKGVKKKHGNGLKTPLSPLDQLFCFIKKNDFWGNIGFLKFFRFFRKNLKPNKCILGG